MKYISESFRDFVVYWVSELSFKKIKMRLHIWEKKWRIWEKQVRRETRKGRNEGKMEYQEVKTNNTWKGNKKTWLFAYCKSFLCIIPCDVYALMHRTFNKAAGFLMSHQKRKCVLRFKPKPFGLSTVFLNAPPCFQATKVSRSSSTTCWATSAASCRAITPTLLQVPSSPTA